MPNLTKDQALQIAQMFSGFAQAVEDYRFAHLSELSDFQVTSLRNVESQLRRTSDDFIDEGMNHAIDDAATALTSLGEVTGLLRSDLAKLADINRALQVVTGLVQLGAAFATGSPAGIASALQSTFEALRPPARAAG